MLARIHALLLSLLLAIAPAVASQNAIFSPTVGTVSGLNLTNNYNNALDSLNTANSGTTSPVNQLSGSPSLGNFWLNSTSSPYPLAMNDGASNWPKIAWLDATAHAWNVQIGGGSTTIASATTTDLCSTSPNYLTVTGTVTITGFGSTCAAGVVKLITFNNTLTLTYNASSLIIPGAANVTTAAGDQAAVVALGSGNWQVANYTPATGAALVNPAIDVGSYVLTAAYNVPSSKYLFAQGQAVSRTTYATLLGIITTTQSVTRTNGSPTLTGFSDTTQINTNNGASVEGAGIPANTTISSCTSSTCTMNNNAGSSGTANVQIFNNGNGNGSTTFNLPDCRGRAFAGRDNMGGTAAGVLTSTFSGGNPDALGATLGSQSQTLTQAQLPVFSQTPTFTGTSQAWSLSVANILAAVGGSNYANAGGGVLNSTNPTVTVTPAGTISAVTFGSGNAHPIVPPMLTANCLMRVLP
jgi:microcystin-dependent protein